MSKPLPVGIVCSVFSSSDLTVLPLAFPNPRTRMSGLPSPPPSDETAPPSSPTPSVRFDSNGVFTRYKLVRAKIRQVRIYPTSVIVPSLYCLTYSIFQFTSVAKGARCSTLGYPRAGELWCPIPRSRIHTRRYRYVEWRDCFRYLVPAPVRLSLLCVCIVVTQMDIRGITFVIRHDSKGLHNISNSRPQYLHRKHRSRAAKYCYY